MSMANGGDGQTQGTPPPVGNEVFEEEIIVGGMPTSIEEDGDMPAPEEGEGDKEAERSSENLGSGDMGGHDEHESESSPRVRDGM